jgi:hypothetical protein
MVKIDSIGDIVWSQCYGSSGNEMLDKDAASMSYGNQGDLLVATPDGGYAILGTTSRPDTMGDVSGYHGHVNNTYFTNKAGDLWLFKIDGAGVLQWQKCIGGSINEEPGALLIDDNGGFIIGATTSSSNGDATGSGYHGGRNNSFEGGDMWVLKTDSVGTILWQKCFGGAHADWLNNVTKSKEGGYLLSGISSSVDQDVWNPIAGTGTYTPMPLLIKINDTGSIEWSKSYKAANMGERIRSTFQNLAGEYMSIYQASTGYTVTKLDSTGIVWNFNNNSNASWENRHIIQNTDGSYMVVGKYASNPNTVFVQKYAACPSYTYEAVTICKGTSYTFGSQTITEVGIYYDTLVSVISCDSIVKLIVTVDSIVVPSITATGNTLSTGTYTSYQWLDGSNNPISGATAQTYEATAAGNYRVLVTGANGCSDTSIAYNHTPSSINKPTLFSNMKLYPNPVSDVVYIEMPELKGKATVTINTLDGRTLVVQPLQGTKQSLSIENLPTGIYFIKITTGEGAAVRKIVKE